MPASSTTAPFLHGHERRGLVQNSPQSCVPSIQGAMWCPITLSPAGRPLRGWWPSARTAAPPSPSSKWHMVSAAQGRRGWVSWGLGGAWGGRDCDLGVSQPLCVMTVAGVGFGLMSGAFSMINLLADALGPGTVGIHGDSQLYFLTSGEGCGLCLEPSSQGWQTHSHIIATCRSHLNVSVPCDPVQP